MAIQNTTQSATTTSLVVDADDFYEGNSNLDLLFRIKKEIPEFKISLFTVVGKCSPAFIKYIKTIDWIDMIPHGWEHRDSYECLDWDLTKSKEYFDKVDRLNLTRGFKAPGWQISDHMYVAAEQHGYWVADQDYNDSRRPKAVSVYKLDKPWKRHFHVQNVCGNGLEESLSEILAMKGHNFKFIKEIL